MASGKKKKISVELSQEEWNCLNDGLRDDLSPEQWVKDAVKGKLSNCKKRHEKAQLEKLKKNPEALKKALESLEG